MIYTGKKHNIIIIDDPIMMEDRKPHYNRSKLKDLNWFSNPINQGWAYDERDRLMEQYPAALVKVERYQGDFRVKITFNSEEDEALFVMKESS